MRVESYCFCFQLQNVFSWALHEDCQKGLLKIRLFNEYSLAIVPEMDSFDVVLTHSRGHFAIVGDHVNWTGGDQHILSGEHHT